MNSHAPEGSDLDTAVAAWQGGAEPPEFAAAVTEWAASLAAYARRTRPQLAASEDLEADALEWVLVQMRTWRPGEGNVRGFLASRFDWFCSDMGRQQFDMPTKGWQRVGAIAMEVREELLAADIPDTVERIRVGCQARLEGELERAVRSANPRWGAARVAAEVAARLRKDGLANALDRLPEVLVAFAPPLRLDAPVSAEDERTTFGASLRAPDADPDGAEADVDQAARVMLGDDVWARQALNARFEGSAEGGDDSRTYKALAAECGRSVEEVKAVLRLASARVSAPHAQWAHLADARLFAFNAPESAFADA